MAQEVGYFENNVTYTEGPFVIVDANGWRIEVETDQDPGCPALPDMSIYKMADRLCLDMLKTEDRDQAARTCDQLNEWVREGRIVKRPRPKGNGWYWCAAPDPPNMTPQEYRDLLAELLFELISDDKMHPDHPANCGCVYSQIKWALGPTRTKRVVEDARPNSSLDKKS